MPGYRQVFEQSMKRGQSFARQQAWDRAIIEFQRALGEFPDDQNALSATAAVLINLSRLPDALAVLQHAYDLKPDDIKILERLASVQEQLGKTKESAQSYVSLGDLYEQQSNTEQAIGQWTHASQLDPDHLLSHQKLAAAYQMQSQPKLAANELIILSRLYRKNGNIDQAAEQCRAALAIDPRNTDTLKLMSEIRVERGTGSLPPLPEPSTATPSPAAPALPSPPAMTLDALGTLAAKDTPAGPVDMAKQRALSDLAESIFEEKSNLQPRRGARACRPKGASVGPLSTRGTIANR